MTKKQKVLIFGNGQVGNFYNDYFQSKGINSQVSLTDVTKEEDVDKAVKKAKPDIVINAAGKTNLEWIDANKLQAFNVNVLGALNVARACKKYDCLLVHTSSGCIFLSKNEKDAKKEGDAPEPIAFYSWTRVWAEDMVGWVPGLKYLILRLRQPVSAKVSPKNMLVKMLTFSKFAHQHAWNSGTVLEDLMWITEKLIDKGKTGVFHVANEGYTTPYEIAILLKKYVNPSMKFQKITHEHLVDEVISIGDYILTGGEIPAMVLVDSIIRLVPGVLGKDESSVDESHKEPGYLEYPQYTRPEDYKGWKVPQVLLSGNHAEIAKWRKKN